jgi:deoxyribonuclease-4
VADRARFGPAGVPHMFKLMGAELVDVPKLLQEEDLDAFEYAAVRWGQVPQIKRENAEALGVEARRCDVLLSLHGSYFINLFGVSEIVEASKRRLIACATAAEWMGAYVVVFHAGFYGGGGRVETYRKCVDALRDVSAQMKALGIEKVKLGPETMGRHSQFGNLDEVLGLCQEVEGTQLVIDWSHLHARTGGGFRTVNNFRDVVVKAEEKLGTEAVRNMHCHFSKIEYTYKSGEKQHHTLDEPGFGPEFELLAKVISEFRLCPVVVCETAVQDVDARKMRDILRKVEKRAP